MSSPNSSHIGRSVSFRSVWTHLNAGIFQVNRVSFDSHLIFVIHRAITLTGNFMWVRKRWSKFLFLGSSVSLAWLTSRELPEYQSHIVLGHVSLFWPRSTHPFLHSSPGHAMSEYNAFWSQSLTRKPNQTKPNAAFSVIHLTINEAKVFFVFWFCFDLIKRITWEVLL